MDSSLPRDLNYESNQLQYSKRTMSPFRGRAINNGRVEGCTQEKEDNEGKC